MEQTFKVFVALDADMVNDTVTTTISHVLIVTDANEVLAARYSGNNGTIFTSESDAQKAIDIYRGAYCNRVVDCEITRI